MTKEFIDNAIEKAANGQSGIGEDVLQVKGFSTRNIRALFHALCDQDRPLTYLEVGLFYGASFFAALNENVIAVGIEDHSQDFSEGFDNVKKELKENFEKFKKKGKSVSIIYADCFSMDKSLLPNNVDIYCYDAEHSLESTAKSLPYFFDKLADKFILIYDDINWAMVSEGINQGLNELKDKIEIENVWMLRGYQLQNDPVYHNGVGIYLINKK